MVLLATCNANYASVDIGDYGRNVHHLILVYKIR